jgi:ElaB/YqjD/DUF883 family membrane-anchored ribosome-binding protein
MDEIVETQEKPTNTADKLHYAADRARTTAADAYATARQKASEAFGQVKDKSQELYETAREHASAAGERGSQAINDAPLAILAGGIALGALLGGLLPRTDKEEELLAPLGDKIGEVARNALQAAREAGVETLDSLGLNRDAAQGQISDLIANLTKALGSAGSAASEILRDKKS